LRCLVLLRSRMSMGGFDFQSILHCGSINHYEVSPIRWTSEKVSKLRALGALCLRLKW
jgi:hypothetical protein